MTRRTRRTKDERGSILVLSTVGLILALIAGGVAVDLGFIAQEARQDQKVADLAAMDAARVLPTNPTVEAKASAARNGFSTGTGYSVTAVEGGKVGTACQAVAGAGAVCVTVTSPHKNTFPFVKSSPSVVRTAVASKAGMAQFSIGSDLAHVDTSAASIANLNKIMGGFLGTTLTLNAVGYQGLAGGTVSLAELVAADSSLGTPSTLLSNSTSVRKLAQASVTALNTKATGPPPDTAAAAAKTPLATFAGSISTTINARLGDILGFSQPADNAAATAQINVFDLITSAGELAVQNGTHFITVPGLTIGVPGLTSSTLKLTVIEAPRISNYGPARFDAATGKWATTAHTAQIDIELTNQIAVAVPPVCTLTCLPSALSVTLNMPLKIAGAEATGSLTAVRCTSPKQNDIVVDTAGTHALANNVLGVSLLGVPLPLPPVVQSDVVLAGGTTSPPMTFTGPTYPTAIQSTAATGAGLTSATTSQFTVLGANLGPVLALLNPVTTAIDNQILGPLFNALGLSIGGADVVTMRVDCDIPTLLA